MALRSLMPRDRETALAPQRRTDPFLSLRQEFDRLFDDVFGGTGLSRFTGQEGMMMPNVDICETEDSLQVIAELPGVEDDDIDVQLSGDVLTIRGEKKSDREERDEKDRNYHLVERSYGSFARSIRLPFAVDRDKVDATFDKGVLTVSLPKPSEARQKTRHISVKRGEKGAGAKGVSAQEKRRAG